MTKINVLNNVIQIERNIIGEIDVSKLNRKFPFEILEQNPEFDNIFIECKHYNTKIPLTTAAKVFCSGIYYQPKFLIIISSKPLYKQALEYAERFFNTGYNQKKGCFYSGVRFLSTSIENLLGVQAIEVLQRKEASGIEKNIEIYSWEIEEEGTFAKKIVFESRWADKTISIDNALKYSLRIWLFIDNLSNNNKISIIDAHDSKRLNGNIQITYVSGELLELNFH